MCLRSCSLTQSELLIVVSKTFFSHLQKSNLTFFSFFFSRWARFLAHCLQTTYPAGRRCWCRSRSWSSFVVVTMWWYLLTAHTLPGTFNSISTNSAHTSSQVTSCQQTIIDAARIICRAGSMKRSSVRRSVCQSVPSTAAAAATVADGFAAELPVSRRSIASGTRCRRAMQQAPAYGSKCGQRHVDSRRRRQAEYRFVIYGFSTNDRFQVHS